MADNTQYCPLCGQANLCAVANDLNAEDCWCKHTPIRPELIAQANQQAHYQRCICQHCANTVPNKPCSSPRN